MGPHEKRERFWIELSPRATTSDERRQRVLKVLCPGKGSWMMSVGVRVRERKKNDLATWHWKQWQYLKPNIGQSFPLSLCGPNRPISTCPQSLFQSESKRHIFVMVIRSNFNMNGNCYSYQKTRMWIVGCDSYGCMDLTLSVQHLPVVWGTVCSSPLVFRIVHCTAFSCLPALSCHLKKKRNGLKGILELKETGWAIQNFSEIQSDYIKSLLDLSVFKADCIIFWN